MAEFRKSSYSDANGAECMEVARTLDAVRDSKNPGVRLEVELGAFLTAVRSGRLENR